MTTDWYVLFGHPERRRWEDARRFGFVSGGGGEWLVRVRWSVAVGPTRREAYWRPGLFYRRAVNVERLPEDVAEENVDGLGGYG